MGTYRVIGRATMVITLLRVLIAHLISTHEPASKPLCKARQRAHRMAFVQHPLCPAQGRKDPPGSHSALLSCRQGDTPMGTGSWEFSSGAALQRL